MSCYVGLCLDARQGHQGCNLNCQRLPVQAVGLSCLELEVISVHTIVGVATVTVIGYEESTATCGSQITFPSIVRHRTAYVGSDLDAGQHHHRGNLNG